MKRRLLLSAAFSLLLGAAQLVCAHNNAPGDYEVNHTDPRMSRHEYRPGEIILKLKTDNGSGPVRLRAAKGKVSSSSSSLENLLRENGIQEAEPLMTLTGAKVSVKKAKGINGQPVADSDLSGLYAIRFDTSKTQDIHSLINELQNLHEVEYAEPNYIVHICAELETYTSDPLYSQQWGPAAIGLDKMWEMPMISTKRPIIAILDTGVDITHPDLAENIWTNSHEANGADNRDDDGNGFIDDIHGWDFVNNSARIRDNNGHGTHCAGIAGAVGGNGIGITGANPDAYIMPIAVLQSNGTGDISTIIKGIDYATANGADVLSMSFGTYSTSIAFHDALAKAYQKAVLVAAAGNDYLCINPHPCPINKEFGAPSFPAAYSFVLGVEASADANGTIAGFSNFDCDGRITSMYPSELYNYELRAPGTGIISTFPNGQYKSLNGTSMACPLAAGAISRLMACREVSSKEELFGDLIATANGNVNVFSAYSLTDADRKPTLSLVTYRLDDVKMGDGDGRPDAGETIRIYPTFRNSWGNARNITYSIKLHELEDPNIIEFIDSEDAHVISNLSSYASVEAESPFLVKINPDCVDGRIIRFVLEATCDNISESLSQEIELIVENGIELGGILKEDITLQPGNNYIITSMLMIPEKKTLTILPGSKITFKDNTGIGVENGTLQDLQYPNGGKIIAKGDSKNRITFITEHPNQNYSIRNLGVNSELEYCLFNNLNLELGFPICVYKSIFKGIQTEGGIYLAHLEHDISGCTVQDSYIASSWYNDNKFFRNSNIVRNVYDNAENGPAYYPNESNNYLNNCFTFESNKYLVATSCGSWLTGKVLESDNPSYFGSDNPAILANTVWDINNLNNHTVGNNLLSEIDLSNRLTRPNPLAPGIVWKVVVNDYDAQDEYEYLPPLGVGKHKFEVYFSKPMNQEKIPFIAMGVREPYTQTAIAEDGSWRSETMENGDVIDIYTVYLTIKGKDNFDGVNTIYVADAEDEEYFPIPIEDVRFHVNVQSAGAMSTGFTAEAGVGKVKLTWENPEENFDDMLGYNMYRYTLDENEVASEPVKINETLLTEEELIDYDIVPGTTYCYYYKVLRTSLDENAPSRVVAATPRAAGKGDADASGEVDVADVVTEVNYMVGRVPKPFIFDAADVNGDSEIDILDVVGTVNIIMNPESVASMAIDETPAVYTIENGILYVDSPVELAGVQLDLRGTYGVTEFKTLDALKGMETSADWLTEDYYRFLAFSLSGKTLANGKNALLEIGDADVERVILVDTKGNRVAALLGTSTGISSVVGQQIRGCWPNPFNEELNVLVNIATNGNHDVEIALCNLSGATVLTKNMTLGFGEQAVALDTASLAPGFYIVTLKVDGKDVQSVKAIKK
ncbi:MAG: S8 family serine peptidase [Bacteroides sp.]|nr:S8 family serine peptidase [Bacteroides sp.]